MSYSQCNAPHPGRALQELKYSAAFESRLSPFFVDSASMSGRFLHHLVLALRLVENKQDDEQPSASDPYSVPVYDEFIESS